MIELKDVRKTYKAKKGKSTKALDGVSLTLGNQGMTFILGKSGSGKSTLLNVLGGLDKYDSGDMIILGKSSKSFTQADFDSYRNTYVGFIFQEFNILEDYDVYQNIELALQLQQKEVKKKEINELLEKLELTELKKRKVNELSGGQKQRVAIARALIKQPRIILADEPTGNLDSKTGRQVMDLLKEISKEKLVVIVSHDEEYAKEYGDRIIEIKDGKVVGDSNEVKENKDEKNLYQTIKSHLPLKDSFRLGIGSLKHKKVKLVFTILLTVATLGFLSCTDTLSSYNFSTGHAKLLADKNEQFIQVEKNYVPRDAKGKVVDSVIQLSMDDSTLKDIQSKVNQEGYEVYKYYGENSWDDSSSIVEILRIGDENSSYYSEDASEIVVTSDVSKILRESITGRNPSAPNEIVIPNFVANAIIEKGITVHEIVTKNEFKESYTFFPKTYEEILNTNYTYYFGKTGSVKIVGIINYDLSSNSSWYQENVLNKIYVNPSFITNFKIEDLNSLKSYYRSNLKVSGLDVESSNEGMSMGMVSSSGLNHEIEYFDGTEWKKTSELKENEVILHISQLDSMRKYYDDLNNYMDSQRGYNSYGYDYDALAKRFYANFISEKNVIGNPATLRVTYQNTNQDLVQEYNNLTVIGVYYQEISSDYSQENNYLSAKVLDPYIKRNLEKSSILYPMTSRKEFKKISSMFPIETEVAVKSTYSFQMSYEKGIFDTIKTLASYVGTVFIVFTAFLIVNFMFNSISYRKKEIGVLRALGSRSLDVMKIFLWEAFCLSIISGTIASILLVVVSNFMNSYIMTRMAGMLTTPFIVGFRQFAVIYILVFSVTFISSILPLIKISRMKPIDAILNK